MCCLIVAKGAVSGNVPVGGLNILQINLNHCNDANDALTIYALNNNIDIILCQDPYVSDGVASGIPSDWPIFFSDSLNSAIIFTNRDYAVISNLVLKNAVIISLNVSGDVIYLGSQYSSPSGNIDKDFVDLGTHFQSFDKVLLAGDFNVPLLELGYTRQSERTEVLLEHLIEKDLIIMNDTDAPSTFVQGDLTGRPDLTLGGLDICDKINNWYVDDRVFSYSDHRYIRFNLGYTAIKKMNNRYKTKNKSFKKFNGIIKDKEHSWLQNLLIVRNAQDLDEHVNNFMTDIECVTKNCFRMGSLSYKSTIRWYSDELRTDRNKVAALYKRCVKNPDDENIRENYRNHRRAYSKKVKKAKRDSWEKFCNSTNNSYGNLYKYIAGKTTKHSDFIFTRLDNSEPFDSYDDVAKLLMEEHFGVDRIPGNVHDFVADGEELEDFKDVSSRELKYIISKQSNNKAPGVDALDALIIKNICKTCINYIKKLFGTCLKYGHFPEAWKSGKVIFFRKRNKDGKTARAYRPITLLCIMGKLLERLIKIRVMPKLEARNFWDKAQHGFREKKSTITALEYLRAKIKRNLKVFKYYSIASIDIQAAFDAVSWNILARLIDGLPISKYLKNILKNYISRRKIAFTFTDGLKWFLLYRGCPQGSCLGPLLWLIVADYLLKKYRQRYGHIISYADDFVVLAGADTRRELEDNMNKQISWFEEICTELELTISSEKCVAMLFGRYLLENRHPIFKIGNMTIPVKDEMVYLGLTLDSKMNWIAHMEKTREKVRNFTSNVKKTAKREKGLHAMYRKIWYKSVIEKQIMYGAEVWFQDLNYHAKRKLSSSQRLGLLTIISSYRTVSTEALCVLAGVSPIHITIEYMVKKHRVLKGDATIDSGDIRIHRNNVMRNLVTSDYPNYTDLKNLQITEKKDTYYHNSISPLIYTDGSKMINGVGAAFTVCVKGNFIYDKKISLHKLNSIYQAELVAIKQAIAWLINSNYNKAIIYTDNKASTLALQWNFPGNDIIRDIYKIMNSNLNKTVTIGWTRAHVGNEGNERADKLAKEAIDPEMADMTLEVPFPISLVRRLCKEGIKKSWQEEWSKSVKGPDTYSVIRKVDEKYLCVSQVIQYYISGHGSFPEYLCKIGKRSNSKCDCGKTGNVLHYLFGRCPFVPYFFFFDNSQSVRYNVRRVLFSKENYRKLCDNYNSLNALYSFIRYRF